MIRRFFCRSMVLALSIVMPLQIVDRAIAQEKPMTPLSGGVPVIDGIKPLETGASAPDFTIRDTEGVPVHFAMEMTKKPTLLVFWSIFCEPCRFEMPVIQKMHDKHRDAGLSVLAVALDGEPL